MENKKLIPLAFRPIHDTDVTTWHLPDGAIARLGQGLLQDIDFSNDGEYLCLASGIGFWIYDTETLTPRALWGTETGKMQVATFSYDAQWIATGDIDGYLRVWDTQNGQCITQIDWGSTRQYKKNILHVHFSLDGQRLSASGFGHSAVYDWRTNPDVPIASFTLEDPKLDDYKKDGRIDDRYFPNALSSDGNLLAYVSSPNTVTLSDINTGEQIAHLTEHPAPVHSLRFSPCGQYLAGANLGTTVQVWNIQNESLETAPITYQGKRVKIAYTPDGILRVADIYKGKVIIWDSSKQEKLNTFNCSGVASLRARFSNDASQFAIFYIDNKIQIWKAGTPSTRVLYFDSNGPAYSVEFLQDGSTLVSSHWGWVGKLFWNIATRKTHRIFPSITERPTLRRTVVLSPCEELLATDAAEGNIKIWDIASETLVAELTDHRHVIAMKFAPTGKYLVSAGTEGELFVWNVVHWKKQHSLQMPEKELSEFPKGAIIARWAMGDIRVAFHPDGYRVAAISYNDKARIWDVESGEHLSTLPLPENMEDAPMYKGEPESIQLGKAPDKIPRVDKVLLRSIAFSPCGTVIACGRLYEVILWDAASSQIRMVISLSEACRMPCALAFSPCGGYIAVGSWWCGTKKVPIQLWEITTGECIHTYWGHYTDIQDLAFSPDGTLLASGSHDSTILLWDMKPYLL